MTQEKVRYYFHGDEHDQRLGTYYCAKCDSFSEELHFYDDTHWQSAEVKLKHTQSVFSSLEKGKTKTKYFRSKKAKNLFLAPPGR